MKWTSFSTRKYQDITLPQLLFKDADYFFWAEDAGVFRSGLAEEVREIYSRATSIRIPARFPEHIAQYVIHRPTDTFQDLRLIHKSDHQTQHAWYSDVIDFSVPHQMKRRDKLGNRNLVKNLKFYLFEDESIRLSKQRCESFFSDDSNFVRDH